MTEGHFYCQRCGRLRYFSWLPPDGVDYCTCDVIVYLRELERIGNKIDAEIDAIDAEPVIPADYKPEDWLPTGEECERLLEED